MPQTVPLRNPSLELCMVRTRGRIQNEKGFALFATFLIVVLLASLGASSLIASSLDLKATAHYKTGTKAMAAAEAGLVHALSSMNTRGVMDFKNEVVSYWDNTGALGWFGSSWNTMSGDSTSKYKVWVAACSSSMSSADYCPCTTGCANLTRDYGILYATGIGGNDANRTLKVRLRRGIVAAPGALFLLNSGPVGTWNGASFEIDGNNHDIDGNLDNSENPRPGVATRDDSTTSSIKAGISGNEIDNFTGLGYDTSTTPHTPSVLTASGPSPQQAATMAQQILDSTTSEIVVTSGNITTNSLPNSCGSNPPVLLHLKNTSGVKITGNGTYCGIVIAEGPLTFVGNISWKGLVLAKSTVKFSGNSTVVGSIWTTGVLTTGGGNARVYYSTEALQLADGIGTSGVNVPKIMTVTSWEETDTPAGNVTFSTSY